MKKIAIYVRVSTREKGQDIENQLLQLKKYCIEKNWQIYKIYKDEESGQKDRKNRSDFNQMFKDARSRKFKIVLFWALDRFSREGPYKTFKYLKELDNYGVKFISYTEEYLNTENELIGEILISIISTLAKYESKRISERTKAGLERAKNQYEEKGKKMPTKALSDRPARKDLHILVLLKDNMPLKRIAKKLDISINTVKKYKNEFIKKGKL